MGVTKLTPAPSNLIIGGAIVMIFLIYSYKAKRCDLYTNYFIKETSSFFSTKTSKVYPIKQTVNCNSDKVIYLATCKKCTIQYVGSTSTPFKVRFRNHKSSMKPTKRPVK